MVEIYVIKCNTTGKEYVGQTVCKVWNHGKLRPYGSHKRWKAHISEANSKKKAQCRFLNNAIRKYGPSDFTVDVLEVCTKLVSDERESWHMKERNTLAPHGYNLLQFMCTRRREVCATVKAQCALTLRTRSLESKLKRFEGVEIGDDPEKYIRPLKRNGQVRGFSVVVGKLKADFLGSYISTEQSYQDAVDFLHKLRIMRRDTLMREHPKAPATHPPVATQAETTVNGRTQ